MTSRNKGRFTLIRGIDPSRVNAVIMATHLKSTGVLVNKRYRYGFEAVRTEQYEMIVFWEYETQEPLGLIVTNMKTMAHKVYEDVDCDFKSFLSDIARSIYFQ